MSELALTALGLGLLSASALLIGAVCGLVANWPERLVAAVMAFGSGALISALAFDLVAEGNEKAGFYPVAIGFLLGAIVFVLANHAINKRGGFLRKPATLYRFLRERRRQHAIALLERLSHIDMLRALPPGDIQNLVPFIEKCHYRANHTIFKLGDPGDALYLIESGTVEIHKHTNEQQATITSSDASSPPIPILGPGDAFGEMALLAGHPHHSTAIVKSDVHLWRIRKDRLEMLEERSPRLASAVEALRARHVDGKPVATSNSEPGNNATPLLEPAHWHAAAVRRLNSRQTATAALTEAEHHAQVQAHAGSGAPIAIFMGALLDGIPESIVIGASLLTETAFSPVFVIAVFLSNIPEALTSAAGMRQYGYRPARVLGLWGGLVICSGLASFLGNVMLADVPTWLIAGTQALAAGGILAMLADTMMPEAFEQGGPLVAVWTALGFLVAFFVKTVSG